LDDFDWHSGAITRLTSVTPSYRTAQMGAVADEWHRRQGDAR
jgi:hypothetical protein